MAAGAQISKVVVAGDRVEAQAKVKLRKSGVLVAKLR